MNKSCVTTNFALAQFIFSICGLQTQRIGYQKGTHSDLQCNNCIALSMRDLLHKSPLANQHAYNLPRIVRRMLPLYAKVVHLAAAQMRSWLQEKRRTRPTNADLITFYDNNPTRLWIKTSVPRCFEYILFLKPVDL